MTRFEERQLGLVTLITEWREVEEFPEFEINRDGMVQDVKSKRIRNTQDGRNSRLRVMRNGRRTGVTIRELRNQAFPELPPW